MPEMRQDPTTKEWVVIATERARRPDQFVVKGAAPSPSMKEQHECPFCPGNEHLTPPEVFSFPEAAGERGTEWKLRVVTNKFAALSPEEDSQRYSSGDFFHSRRGFGYHEVIVESPRHDLIFPLMSTQEILQMFQAYRRRYRELRSEPRIKLILLFRNHGAKAGTSLVHPHSQLVASPLIPFHIRQKYDVAIRHFDDTGHCLYCDVVEKEKAAGERIILETDRLVAFHPFASRVPFETWIAPKRHNPCLARSSDEELAELAAVLRRVVRGLHDALGNPDFNLIAHTAPVEDEEKPYFLWHIEIHPRLTTPAGFELGTGIYINAAIPEETAAFFRDAIRRPKEVA